MSYKRVSPEPVIEGGTGAGTFTAYAVITAGTTATGAFQNVVGVGTSGYVLTSQGAGALPQWAAASGGVTSVNGTTNQISSSNTGSGSTTLSIPSTFIAPGSIEATTSLQALNGNITATSGNVVITAGNLNLTQTTSSSLGVVTANFVNLDGSFGLQRVMHFYGDNNSGHNPGYNTFIGRGAGNFSLTVGTARFNTGVGSGLDSSGTTVHGPLTSLTTGLYNCVLGAVSGGYVSSGSGNTILGAYSGGTLSTGSDNLIIGAGGDVESGNNYSGAESNNIIICNTGVAAETNVIRIGTAGSSAGQQNKFFAAGIYNIAVGATAGVVLADSTSGGAQIGSISGASGTVLVGGTKPAFSALSGLAVTAIAGTANEITASASTGSVTLSTPSTFIAPGSVSATTIYTTTTATSSTAGQYQINGTAVLHNYGTNNIFLGAGAGNFTLTGTESVCVGAGAGNSLTAGGNVTYVGYNAGTLDTGPSANNGNTAIGNLAMAAYTGATGARNTSLGAQSLGSLLTGNHNVALGWSAGSGYTGSESNNISIGDVANGTAGESNTLRIGSGTGNSAAGNLNQAFISGIQGITVTGAAVLVSTSDQLGVVVSSRRFKDNIQDMDDYSSPVLALRPVTFTYKIGDDQSVQSGLIAEEVADVMPQLVVYDKEGLPQTVKYHDLPALLLNEIQKLNKRIEALEEICR